ncbi:accessory Sec system glycosylation chaperone GtfB, partial [Streptococcus agalactiae]|nr:accessory Sec system glycosylation chaperone GtfB [Streptococcus agalactiae]
INPTIALNDDGFLPDDVTSPYLYYTGFAKIGAGRPLYYNELRVPDTWEIIGFSSGADIVDLGVKKGRIIYANPNHRRLIKEVDWFDEQGRVILKDRFNKFGFCFAQTFYNVDGQAIQTSYYNKDGQEVISENHMTGDYILNDNNQFKVFKSKVEFVINYLQEAKFNLDRIFYNSLSTPFLVSFYLNRLESKDVLFWQEPLVDDIPGNMRLLLNNPSPNTKIVIQSYEAYA